MLQTKKPIVASWIKRFTPSRFLPVQHTIIDKNHYLQPALNHDSVKVLNWNIAKNNRAGVWAKEFLEILNHYQPDVIFLQEVRLCAEAKQITELAEMSWNFAPNFMDAYYNTYSGVLTAAKTHPVMSKSIVTQYHEPVTKTPKISLVTEYLLPNQSRRLLTINTHLINFVSLHKFRDQLQELEVNIAAHDGPVIFSGDFNTWNRSRWELLQAMADRLGLTQVAFAPQESKKIKRFLLSPPLDYIFYKGFFEKPTSATVIDAISSSDHKPLLVEFAGSHAEGTR